MSKKNYYAVKFSNGDEQIFQSWSECHKKISGVSDVNFKGFSQKKAAESWLLKQKKESKKPLNSIKAYVDGSFKSGNPYAGWGFVIVENDNIIHQESGLTNAPALSRNIDGEIQATIEAIKWGMNHRKNLIIFYDYRGIECWAKGIWKAKSPIAGYYKRFIKGISIEIGFTKVKSHSGDKYNEIADALAKANLE